MGPGQPLCGFRDDTQERLALDRGRELRDAPVMALLDWIAPESGLRVEGQGIVLRPPRAADYPEWRELRARSRGFLQPWEPTWPSDDLSRAAFRRRLAAYARDRELGVAHAFFVLRSSDEALTGGITLSNVRRARMTIRNGASFGRCRGASCSPGSRPGRLTISAAPRFGAG